MTREHESYRGQNRSEEDGDLPSATGHKSDRDTQDDALYASDTAAQDHRGGATSGRGFADLYAARLDDDGGDDAADELVDTLESEPDSFDEDDRTGLDDDADDLSVRYHDENLAHDDDHLPAYPGLEETIEETLARRQSSSLPELGDDIALGSETTDSNDADDLEFFSDALAIDESEDGEASVRFDDEFDADDTYFAAENAQQAETDTPESETDTDRNDNAYIFDDTADAGAGEYMDDDPGDVTSADIDAQLSDTAWHVAIGGTPYEDDTPHVHGEPLNDLTRIIGASTDPVATDEVLPHPDAYQDQAFGIPSNDDSEAHFGEEPEQLFEPLALGTAGAVDGTDFAASPSARHGIGNEGYEPGESYELGESYEPGESYELGENYKPDEDYKPTGDYEPGNPDTEPESGGIIPIVHADTAEHPQKTRRRRVLPMVLAALVLLGGAFAFAYTWLQSQEPVVPVVVQADTNPIIVESAATPAPVAQEPGKLVYDRLNNNQTASRSTTPTDAADDAPRVILSDRATQEPAPLENTSSQAASQTPARASEAADTAFTPKTVKTVVVKLDNLKPSAITADETPAPESSSPAVAETVSPSPSPEVVQTTAATTPQDNAQTMPDVADDVVTRPEKPVRTADNVVSATDNTPQPEEDTIGQLTALALNTPETSQTVVHSVPTTGAILPRPRPASEISDTASQRRTADNDARRQRAETLHQINAQQVAARPVNLTQQSDTGAPAVAVRRTSANAPIDLLNPRGQPRARATPAARQPASLISARKASTDNAPAPRGRYAVQVTSQRSERSARDALTRLQRRYSALRDRPTVITRVNIRDKGTFYRGYVNPTNNRDAAVKLCEQLRAAGGDCIIGRP